MRLLTQNLGVKSCNDTKLMIRLRINMKSCDTYNTLPCNMNEEGRCNLLLTYSEYFLRPGNFWKNFVCKGDMIGGINIKIKKSIANNNNISQRKYEVFCID